MTERVQLRRVKGWRLPPHTRSVARPTYYGNPWRVGEPHPQHGQPMTAQEAVDLFRAYLDRTCVGADARRGLRGWNLACWCPNRRPMPRGRPA